MGRGIIVLRVEGNVLLCETWDSGGQGLGRRSGEEALKLDWRGRLGYEMFPEQESFDGESMYSYLDFSSLTS